MLGELFDPIVTTDEFSAAAGDRAWLKALLDAEAALIGALVDVDLAPVEARDAIVGCCDVDRFDVSELGHSTRGGGNPVIPLVDVLRAAVGAEYAPWVHRGATSQDIMDTAAMLVTDRSLSLVARELTKLADGCAVLAERHRYTLLAGRTLLQQAQPITFGFKAAGWLGGVIASQQRELRAAQEGLAVQLGGAVGTLAAYGVNGSAVVSRFAERLSLPEPIISWHTARQRVATVGAALSTAAGTAAKISHDVALLMQTEVGEAAEPAESGRGGSSSMPHKRNPVGAAAVSTATRHVHALLPVLFGALVADHERDLGGWQAEWTTTSEMLALAGGAVARTAETVASLEVDAGAMLANLQRSGGAMLSERVTAALAGGLGASEAARAVAKAARAGGSSREFASALLEDPSVATLLDRSTIEELLDPTTYLGTANAMIDRVLAMHARTDTIRIEGDRR